MLPMLADGVTLRRSQKDGRFYAENARDDVFLLEPTAYRFLMQIDGKTDPAKLLPDWSEERVAELIQEMKKDGLVVTSRFQGVFFATFKLFLCSKRTSTHWQNACGVMNLLLPVLAVLFFAAGVYLFWNHLDFRGNLNLPLYYLLLALSVTAHEFGHYVAAKTYRFRVLHAGVILLFRFFPLGAYIACQPDELVRKRMHSIQFYLAGAEANLLLAGLFAGLACIPLSLSETCGLLAITNVVLVAVNLLPSPLLDGGKVLGAAFGIDNFSLFTVEGFANFKRYLRSGPAGWLCLALAIVGLLATLALIALFVWNIVLIIEDAAALL